MGYEFEDAQNDENNAKMGLGALALGLVGLGLKYYRSSQKEQKQMSKEQRIAQIRQYEARINAIDSKSIFASSAEKEEARRLREELQELKKRL